MDNLTLTLGLEVEIMQMEMLERDRMFWAERWHEPGPRIKEERTFRGASPEQTLWHTWRCMSNEGLW